MKQNDSSNTGVILEASGSELTWRPAKRCEKQLENGLVACYYLSLARLHWHRMESYRDIDGLKPEIDVRLQIRCRVCKGLTVLSSVGCSTSQAGLLWRSMVAKRAGGTFITWQMEQRPTGSESDSVFGAWANKPITDSIQLGVLRTIFGPEMLGTSNTEESQGNPEKQPTT